MHSQDRYDTRDEIYEPVAAFRASLSKRLSPEGGDWEERGEVEVEVGD